MKNEKIIQEFTIPRSRVVPELSQALRTILLNLRKLEGVVLADRKAIQAAPTPRQQPVVSTGGGTPIGTTPTTPIQPTQTIIFSSRIP